MCPSRFWVETKEQKEKLLKEYMTALNKKECKYFRRGDGECPFGNKCFYQHVSADGHEVDVGPPKRRQRRANADGELTLVQQLLIYDFVDVHQDSLVTDYLDILEILSDSDSDVGVIMPSASPVARETFRGTDAY